MSTPPNYVYTCDDCGTVTKHRSTIKRHKDNPARCRGMFYGIKRNKLPLSDFLGLGLGKKGRVMVRNLGYETDAEFSIFQLMYIFFQLRRNARKRPSSSVLCATMGQRSRSGST